jgi:Tfp pilus assembly protein PilF
MKLWILPLVCTLLVSCASGPPLPPPATPLHDELFDAPAQPIDPAAVFALNDEMQQYLRREIAERVRRSGPQRGLLEALYDKRELKLQYDAEMTRNAAQAFDARAGNCLSLVIMTAAFARQLGLAVRYQSVDVETLWSRSGGVYFASGHVNLTLERRATDARTPHGASAALTIDFLPGAEITGLRSHEIAERTVVAMYMNNRAAEALAAGLANEAYWWVREAIVQDPSYLTAYNTLGAIYQRSGHAAHAEQAFVQVLEREPANRHALSNLALLFDAQGRAPEAQRLRQRLASVESDPPFNDFNRGLAAMQRGDYAAARDLFAREVERTPDYHEFHFWLAAANARLGDLAQARKHLALAKETSTSRRNQALYAGKLERLRAAGLQ